jgi:hypothetical protein
METIKAKCTNIVQAESRGTVVFTAIGKDKQQSTQVAVSYSDPKQVAVYEHGKDYVIEIKPVK